MALPSRSLYASHNKFHALTPHQRTLLQSLIDKAEQKVAMLPPQYVEILGVKGITRDDLLALQRAITILTPRPKVEFPQYSAPNIRVFAVLLALFQQTKFERSERRG